MVTRSQIAFKVSNINGLECNCISNKEGYELLKKGCKLQNNSMNI